MSSLFKPMALGLIAAVLSLGATASVEAGCCPSCGCKSCCKEEKPAPRRAPPKPCDKGCGCKSCCKPKCGCGCN